MQWCELQLSLSQRTVCTSVCARNLIGPKPDVAHELPPIKCGRSETYLTETGSVRLRGVAERTLTSTVDTTLSS